MGLRRLLGADRQTASDLGQRPPSLLSHYYVQTSELASVLRPDPPLSGCDLFPFQGKLFIISKENKKSPGCLFTDLYECNGVGCVEIVRGDVDSFLRLRKDIRGVFLVKLKSDRTSLVAQWLRIRLPMKGTQVQALVWEDPTYRRGTKPVRHNY